MKRIVTLLIMFGCGLPPLTPIPPLGCSSMEPVCICDDSGRCSWQFKCVRYGE